MSTQRVELREAGGQILIETDSYSARVVPGPVPALLVAREGRPLLRLPMVAGLASLEAAEELRGARLAEPRRTPSGAVALTLTAESSLWAARAFHWELSADQVVFHHTAAGAGRVGRCYFFSSTTPQPWGEPGGAGAGRQAHIYAPGYFSPRVNHANRHRYDLATPQSLGILNESPAGLAVALDTARFFTPDLMAGLFVPPPLALAFGGDACWAAVGIGERPGLHLFNALDYSGSRLDGAALWVDYHGYRSVDPQAGFESPRAALHFGYSEWEALAAHVAWLDRAGFATQRRFPSPDWHREPIFCGWAEQTIMAIRGGGRGGDYATQAIYERWVAQVEARGIPFGTVVIDDKWQRGYGTFDVDTTKWPDMPGFIARQHAKGRRVLLWVPGHHAEGLDPALCVDDGGRTIVDVTNPDYEAFLRRQVRHLMLEVGADGFKEDWIGGVSVSPGLPLREPLFGIELLRRFQRILYDAAHDCKEDALVETQTPHPLFRESSDVLRLNDLWFATRGVVDVMRARARIARIAGWPLVDCDNASSTTLAEWWEYAQAQPSIGVPALYFVDETESTGERPTEAQWAHLAAIWRQYRREQGLPER